MISKARKEKISAAKGGLCARFLELRPQYFTRDLVVLFVGERSVTSMPMVAKEFGVSSATVKQSWRSAGMPGGEGSYSLPDIVMWKLQHDRDNDQHTRNGANPITDLIRQADLEDKLINLEQKKQRMLELKGESLLVAEVQAELYTLITMVKEMFLSVPRSIAPMLPANIAEETTIELTKQIRHCLTALSNGKVCGIDLAKMIDEVAELIKKHGPLKSGPSKKRGSR